MATVINNTRILGNTLGLAIGGTDYWSDIAEYSLEPADSDKDVLTFADASSGGSASTWTLKGSAIQSTDTASFWNYVWAHAGQTVTFTLAPHGNSAASATQPHFTGQVTIGSKPPIGTAAGEDKGATFDFEWAVVGQPTLATTGTLIPAAAPAAAGTTPTAGA